MDLGILLNIAKTLPKKVNIGMLLKKRYLMCHINFESYRNEYHFIKEDILDQCDFVLRIDLDVQSSACSLGFDSSDNHGMLRCFGNL